MDNVTLLIMVAAVAWLIQILLGWLQIQAFNRRLHVLSAQGKIGIGRSVSRWKPRFIVVISVDSDNNIQDAFIQQGISVFSRPKRLACVVGLNTDELNPEIVFPRRPDRQQILMESIRPIMTSH